MNKDMDVKKRAVKPIVGFRPAELSPLMNLWLEKNPFGDISDLLRQSLRTNPELRKLAGKRYAHLLAA